MVGHIVKRYDQDLEALDRAVSEMGGLAEVILFDAAQCLVVDDASLVDRVVATDHRIDALQRRIEEDAFLVITKRQPVAVDLRACVVAVRMAADIERIGDLARNIASRSRLLAREPPLERTMVGVRTMHRIAARELKSALDAYGHRDVERARAVWHADNELGVLEDAAFRDLLTFMMEDQRNITNCAHLLFCAKNLERIGDHAANLAEAVVYLSTGEASPKRERAGLHSGADRDRSQSAPV